MKKIALFAGLLLSLGTTSSALDLLSESVDGDAFICIYGDPAGYDEEGYETAPVPRIRVIQAEPCDCTYGGFDLISEEPTTLYPVAVEAETRTKLEQ